MSYGLCQKGIAQLSFKNNTKELNSFENALAGSSAAFFASLVLCPTELVKCRLQSAREMSNSANM
jgi:solute carrier family 25 ornithine transporter 2/15